MAHEISVSNGIVEAMYSNTPAWHGLGTVFNPDGKSATDSESALHLAHLDWLVEKRPAKFEANGEHIEVEDNFITVRTDINKGLGVVGNRYTVQQNVECFQFLDGLLQDDVMRYEAAFALQGGRKVVLLARMPRALEIAPGDVTMPYILFSTSHDGSGAITVKPTTVRVQCANMLRMCLSNGEVSKTVRHTANKDNRLRSVAHWISQFNSAFTLYGEKASQLAEKKCSREQAIAYIGELFPVEKDMTERQKDNISKEIAKVRRAFEHSSNQINSIKGTWWQVFNAVTYATDHFSNYRGEGVARKENRFLDLSEGHGADFKDKAFQLALTMAG